MIRRTQLAGLALLLALLGQNASASNACRTEAGRFVSIQGAVEVQTAAGGRWQSTTLEYRLCQGDTIRVGMRSRAAVALINDAVLRLDENTTMRLVNVNAQAEEKSWLDVVRGGIMSFSRKPKRLEVSTPYLNGSIEGTEFAVRVHERESQLTVFEGTVIAANAQGSLPVSGGQTAVAAKGQAPQPRVLVRPRDAVQWSLYYPPVLAGDDAKASKLHEAAELLAVGRVEEAQASVDQAIAQGTDAGLAYALRSVIRVTQNDRPAALADAEKAVSLTDAAAARIALSYAQQADFQIEAARDTMRTAVERHPDDALAWARLAELWLMQGNRREARTAAERAAALQPNLGRTQSVLGFAALAEIRVQPAQEAFAKAIALDSADPMPHLGLGLAKIRTGKLAEGRADIEAAVALDSNSALLRAYLGKAYFEEIRGPLDAEQLAIAKELDPLDPTAFLYNAIRLQTENRPVEALQDLQASIERNDNRAVFRGRLQLDQDRAARGASLAQIYSDLGFARSAIGTARSALTLDPSNASAHRFLSDSYSSQRRREISRVSELLQAQMLQDININPVQPSVSETNLNTMTRGGPSSVGYNEFTPLFERNDVKLDVTGFGGNNATWGGEGVVSALYDRVSLSAGYYHYETDGWRPNNGLEQDIYNIYAQVAVTPELNVQAEFRRRESTEGDLAFNFDPDAFLEDKTIEREQDSVRVGLRYSPSPSTDLLLSYIHSDRTETTALTEPLPFPGLSAAVDNERNDKGDQVEAQYVFSQDRFNVVAGLAYSEVDIREDTSILLSLLIPPFEIPIVDDASSEIKHPRGYFYANVQPMDGLVATLGASYDDYDEGPLKETSFNPKFGLLWNVNDALVLRAAAFKTMKPALVNNRTLEPTQVAGFNQLFDDINATKSTRYGVGFDWQVTGALSVGGELTWRNLDQPIFLEDEALFEERDEELHRAYVYWTPTPRWAVSGEVIYDRFTSEGEITQFTNLPEKVETLSLPVGVKYFLPNGLSAGIAGTYVDQTVERSEFATQAQGSDSFFVVDLSLAYRLPKRLGVVSLEVKNLFGEEFRYQDDSYREFRDEPSTGPYFPETTIWGVARLSF